MIRFKVFIPFVAVFSVLVWIAVYRLDALVKNWVESGISAVTGTKTDITDLKVSLKNSSLAIRRLEIASKEDPWKNTVEFELIKIDFQSLPLLKKKFIVDDFSVKGIAWGTKRRTSGVLPAKPKEPPSWLSKQMDAAWGSLKTEMSQTPVGKLTSFSIPQDAGEVLKVFKFESEAAFTSSAELAQELKGTWLEKFKDLRDVSEYERRLQEARQLLNNPPQDPQKILEAIQTLQGFQSFFQDEIKKGESFIAALKTDSARVQETYDRAQKALNADIARAQGLVSLDDLNVQNISKFLFGNVWLDRAEQVLRYHALLRKFMGSASEEKDIEVKQRAKGRDIVFLVERQTPSFVLSKADFSLKAIESGDRKLVSQLYDLSLRDINSSPKLHGRPTTIHAKGTFKDAIMDSAQFGALLDYTQSKSRDEFDLGIKGLDINDWLVGVPVLFPVRLDQAESDATTKLHFDGDDFEWATSMKLSGSKWNFSDVPNRGILVPLLQDIFKSVDQFHLGISLKYTNGKFDFDVSSDMDSKIKAGIDSVVDKKLKELQARIESEIRSRMKIYQTKAQEELNRFRTDIEDRFKSIMDKTTNYQKEILSIEDQMKKQGQKAAESKVQDGLKQLKKNLPSISNPFK